jgi:mono/diheme cytochrome c family protein
MKLSGFFLMFASLAAVFTFSMTLAYAAADDVKDAWVAPADAAKVANPVAADQKSADQGKKIYTGKCLSCHGSQGKGDGPMMKVLKKKPSDLTSADVAAETDGALFYKITKGQKPMPTFAKSLTDKERWTVVNYIRSLNKSADKK